LHKAGAKEVYMRAACPPLIYSCKFLNFSQSRTELELAGRRAIEEVNGNNNRNAPDSNKENMEDLSEYTNPDSKKYKAMVEIIRKKLGLTSLKYQKLEDLVKAIGLPKDKLCTYCWDGKELKL
jgi:amidophosphoribosyltransferase